MQSHLVVVLLDEFLQVLPQFLHGAVGSGVDFFLLQCVHKALAPTVLPRSPGPAHTENRPDTLQPFHIIIAGVGGSSVGMVQHSRQWPCAEPPRVERFSDSVPAPPPPHAAKRRPIPPPDKRTPPLSAGRSYPPHPPPTVGLPLSG